MNDCTIYLNYAIVLYNNGMRDESKAQFFCSEKIYKGLEEDEREQEMMDAREMLSDVLEIKLEDSDDDEAMNDR